MRTGPSSSALFTYANSSWGDSLITVNSSLSQLARARNGRKKPALRNKEVISAVPAPFLQESALQFRNFNSPARKLQTRSAQSNQPLSAAFCRHNRNVSAAPAKVIRVSIE